MAEIADHVVEYLRNHRILASRDSREQPGHVSVWIRSIKYSLSCNMCREIDVQRMYRCLDSHCPVKWHMDCDHPQVRYKHLFYLARYLERNSGRKRL